MQITCNTSSAYHVQNVYHVVRRDNSTIKFDRVEIAFILALFCWLRLRTGHNRLTSHMHGKLKLASSPTCPCGQEDQITEHVLQRCPLHKATRKDVWPVSTSLTTKLYGCKQELEKTTTFISRADRLVGLVVKASASRAEDPGFDFRLRWDFSGVDS